MKHFVLVILLAFMSSAHADHIDLQGQDVVRASICSHGKQKMQCVWVKKDDKLYMIVIDKKGERSITWISPKGNVLMWSREAV